MSDDFTYDEQERIALEKRAANMYGPPMSFADATAPITETNPHPKPKHIRLRKCGAVLRVPTLSGRAEVVFMCNEPKHDPGYPHQELGFVLMPDGTVREFHIQWQDEGFKTFRQHTKSSKRRVHGSKTSSKEGVGRGGAGESSADQP